MQGYLSIATKHNTQRILSLKLVQGRYTWLHAKEILSKPCWVGQAHLAWIIDTRVHHARKDSRIFQFWHSPSDNWVEVDGIDAMHLTPRHWSHWYDSVASRIPRRSWHLVHHQNIITSSREHNSRHFTATTLFIRVHRNVCIIASPLNCMQDWITVLIKFIL